MNENFYNMDRNAGSAMQLNQSVGLQAYMTKVYGWMFAGILITSVTAYFTNASNLDMVLAGSAMFWLLIIGQFGLVLALSAFINIMSGLVAGTCFLGYSLLNGLTLSMLLRVFTGESIFTTFMVVSVMFAALALYGATTKRNLSGFGQFLFMGLIGLVLTSLLNLFLQLDSIYFLINIIGVIVFAGLTVYDNQRIKEMYLESDGELAGKTAIIGALMLYLDFVNLFIYMLRFVGNRD